MPHNRFWNLLAKKLSGEANTIEMAELEQLLRQNPDWGYAASQIENIWKQRPQTELLNAELAYELHLEMMQQKGISFSENTTQSSPKIKSRRVWLIAGCAAVTLTAVAALFFLKPSGATPQQQRWHEVAVQAGTRTRMLLPDSSVVYLNAGSTLKYAPHFGITNRNVQLDGEGFFEVRKMKIPLVLRAGNVRIKVLGTAFNVRAYAGDDQTETSLIRGKVEVEVDNRPGERFLLLPSEKIIVKQTPKNNTGKAAMQPRAVILTAITPTKDSLVAEETAWVQNRLVFQNETFASLVPRLERWYNVRIVLDSRLRNERLSGTLEIESVQKALEALQLTTSFRFRIQQDSITITQ